MDETFGRGDHYANNLDGLEGFTNDDVPNAYKTYKEAYNGPNRMLDVNDYEKNAKDAEAAADSYETNIATDLNFSDANRNAVFGRVEKRVRTMIAKL